MGVEFGSGKLIAAIPLSLEQINLMMTLYFYRHCGERSDVAIQTAFLLGFAFQVTEPLHGLPRRFAPRNDGRNIGASLN
jgi:hypothetical protein